jgi:hypothetical protein
LSASPVCTPIANVRGDDLEVELSVVAGRDLVEAVVAIGEHAREHVEPARRALRVCLGAHPLRQAQLLDQRDQVGTGTLERGAVAKVDLFEGEILDLLLDRRVAVRQEAAAQRPRALAQAQVYALGLHGLPWDAPRPATIHSCVIASRRRCAGRTPPLARSGDALSPVPPACSGIGARVYGRWTHRGRSRELLPTAPGHPVQVGDASWQN